LYHRGMGKTLTAVLFLALLSGCAWMKKSDRSGASVKNPREGSSMEKTPAFALPGVPMRNNLPAEKPRKRKKKTTEAAPGETIPREAAPDAEPAGEPKPAAAAPVSNGDLEFHLSAAAKYAAGRKYNSAAAEYGAAAGFLPAFDIRAVHLLERQGAMLLRAGNMAKAQGYFSSAIEKAKELKSSGNDLAMAHLGLGYCLERENKISEAIANYEKVLDFTTSKTIKARVGETIDTLKKPGK